MELSINWSNTVAVTHLKNGVAVDGVMAVTGQHVLLKNQNDPIENGIYTITATGVERAADFAAGFKAHGSTVIASQGVSNADKAFIASSEPGSDVVGTQAQTFHQLGGSGGDGTTEDNTDPTADQEQVHVDGSTIDFDRQGRLQTRGGSSNAIFRDRYATFSYGMTIHGNEQGDSTSPKTGLCGCRAALGCRVPCTSPALSASAACWTRQARTRR